MSSPLIFDTGVIIALFNKREEATAKQVEGHLEARPHSPRIMFEPNLVELFYRAIKKHKMSPSAIRTVLDHFGIELYPLPPEYSVKISQAYMSITYNAVFDYADFYMCAASLRIQSSEILTVDRDDLPNALSHAIKAFDPEGSRVAQLVPFV